MSILNRFKRKDDKISDIEMNQINGFLINLFEKPPYDSQIRSKVDESNFVYSSVVEIVKHLSKDSRMNLGMMRKYHSDPNFTNHDFVALYRDSKSHFDDAKMVNFICARIAQELLFDNYFPGLYAQSIKGLSRDEVEKLLLDNERIKLTVKNKLKEMIKGGDPQVAAMFTALCKIIHSILTS